MIKTSILAAVAIVEAIVIVVLVTTDKRLHILERSPVPVSYNPLREAVDYEASDQKFEQLVKQFPHLISDRTKIKGAFNSPLLADCAILNRTNYARILIANGADVEDAVKSLQAISAEEAIRLLRQVQSETSSKTIP